MNRVSRNLLKNLAIALTISAAAAASWAVAAPATAPLQTAASAARN